MKALYVVSGSSFSGKSTMCAGLGAYLKAQGLRVGYIKPVSPQGMWEKEVEYDDDVRFMKRTFGLLEPLDVLSPVVISHELMAFIFGAEREIDLRDVVQKAFQVTAQDKDIVLVEGAGGLTEGALAHLSAFNIAELLDLPVLLIDRYRDDLSIVELPLVVQETMGDRLIGVVFNAVPQARMEFVTEEVAPFITRRGLQVLGVLPQERLLLSVTVGELAERLGGEILCCAEKQEDLVENFMVGAMSVDSALEYFRRVPNKAVITGGDRPDIQLAALQTSTRCLILTGNMRPSEVILFQAEEQGVPIILVKPDTLTTVEEVEQLFGTSRFHQERKIVRFEFLLRERFDFDTLFKALGIEIANSAT